jgi:hypothetical protein
MRAHRARSASPSSRGRNFPSASGRDSSSRSAPWALPARCATRAIPKKLVRTMVFSTLVIANIGLTLVNRSFTASVLSTFRQPQFAAAWHAAAHHRLLGRDALHTRSSATSSDWPHPHANNSALAAVIGLASVLWFEVYKWIKRRSTCNDVDSFSVYSLPRLLLRSHGATDLHHHVHQEGLQHPRR